MEDADAFDAVLAVLKGERRFELDASSAKLLRFLLVGGLVTGGDADALITPRQLKGFFGARRYPSSYVRELAPPVVSVLMERARLARVDCPVLAEIPAGTIEAAGARPWSYPPRRVWIVPSAGEVKLAFRDGEPRDVPVVHELRQQPELELPDWGPRPATVRELDAPLTCPHCGKLSTRYRDLADALVCLGCARSFHHP